MNIAQLSQTRYTTKAFDPARKIPESSIEQVLTLLRHSPSSVNSQPWHFIVASSDAGKARIAKATQTAYTYNELKIRNASHVVLFCAHTELSDTHLATILEQEDKDGRFSSAEAKAGQNTSRSFYANLHRYDKKDARHWMEKQVYLALGTLLLGAATLEIDACPIEGFDPAIIDEEFNLRAKGLSSVVIACLGYRSADDFNAKQPKSRLPAEQLFTVL